MTQADDDARLRFVVFTMLLDVALSTVSAVLDLGWRSAAAIVTLIIGLYLVWTVRHRDALLLRLLVLGLAAGLVEILADWYAVAVTETLVYPAGEPIIGRSPAYMPFAWTTVLVQLGTIGAWLTARIGLLMAALATGVIGGVNIPIYEALARRATWWSYHGAPAILGAPWYIIGAEFLIALAVPLAVRIVANRAVGWSVPVGVALGLWMTGATMLAFRLFG